MADKISWRVTTTTLTTEVLFEDRDGLFSGLLQEREPGKMTVFGVGIGSPVRLTPELSRAMLPFLECYAHTGQLTPPEGWLRPCRLCGMPPVELEPPEYILGIGCLRHGDDPILASSPEEWNGEFAERGREYWTEKDALGKQGGES